LPFGLLSAAGLRRELRGIAIALLMVAVTTLVVYVLALTLEIRRGSAIYLIPVLLAGWHLGLIPALVAAAAGVLCSGYFFFAPYYSFFISRPGEILNLLLFMVVAAVTSHLANSMKRQTEIARRREKETADLYAFSRRLAVASSAADIYRAIEEHVASLVERKVVLFGGGATAKASPQAVPVSERIQSAVSEVQAGRTLSTTVDDGRGDLWLVRRVSPKPLSPKPLSLKTADFGVIAIDLGSVPAGRNDEVRQQVDDVLADAAATLERLDVASALTDAKMRSETELLREALIGSVSHELRTPLASILGAATVLSNSEPIMRDERLNALATVVRDEAERLNNDIQNLLDATRVSRKEITPRQEWIEPQDIVNSALARRRRLLTGRKLVMELESNLPLVYVDAILVAQAFVQLVDNAAKYSLPAAPIMLAARRNAKDVVLSVRDEGVGLTAEERAHIFDRFFRGQRHAATTSGSGLGLWIAQAFVSANGGYMEAQSAGAGQGTTVAIHLPFASPASEPEIGADE
jgi:two-component system, OmpR family, sensor histidine kinase KdpD